MRDAIAVLNRWDLPEYCRRFTPEGREMAPQLRGVTGCDDDRLQRMMVCTGCERDIQIETLGAEISGDNAVVHVRVRGFRGAAQAVTKDVRLVRRDGAWLLLSNPDASVP